VQHCITGEDYLRLWFMTVCTLKFTRIKTLNILMFFILVHVTFFSNRCMFELKFAIYYRAASFLCSKLPMQYWLKNHRLSSNTPRTPAVFLIQQSCIIGASLSEPHTSVISLHSACVCLLACLDRPLTINHFRFLFCMITSYVKFKTTL